MKFAYHIRPALGLVVTMTLLLGAAYPLLITAGAQGAFHEKANGSLIERDGTVVGAKLIGQSFSEARYFWGRLSGTTPPYNAMASAGANLAPSNPALVERANARLKELQKGQPVASLTPPQDLITSSASGLDPHISVEAALYQVPRVARARGMKPEALEALINARAKHPLFGFIGEPRVNVLKLNLALDAQK